MLIFTIIGSAELRIPCMQASQQPIHSVGSSSKHLGRIYANEIYSFIISFFSPRGGRKPTEYNGIDVYESRVGHDDRCSIHQRGISRYQRSILRFNKRQ